MKKALCFNDVLIAPKHWNGGSRSEVSLATNVAGINLDIPLISANMASVTETAMCIAIGKKGGLGILHRMCSIDEQVQMVLDAKRAGVKIGGCIGIDENAISNAGKLIEAGCDLICIDVAFFAQDRAHEVAAQFRKLFDYFPLIVGNIATGVHVFQFEDFLSRKGIEPKNLAHKVGIGGSGVCSTRTQSGNGLPTFHSLMDISEFYFSKSKSIIADGGHATPGDCVKSLAMGAKTVMVGSLLAGTSATPGDIIVKDGKKHKEYFGNASSRAKIQAGLKNHNIEGIATIIPYKGATEDVIDNIVQGMKSGCTYSGAKNLKELREKAEFVEITTSGYKESTPYLGN